MARSEKFTSNATIKKVYAENINSKGVPIYSENGQVYCDNGENHIKVVGNSGSGKTQGEVLPLIDNIINSGESAIVTDLKGELTRLKAKDAIDKGYNTIIIDMRNPYHSPSHWDPLASIRNSYNEGTIAGRDAAASQIADFAYAIQTKCDDQFWPNSSAELVRGLIYLLLEQAPENEINIKSLCNMMLSINERIGAEIAIKKIRNNLPNNSQAKRDLSTYCNAPNDTRNSIYSVASNALGQFSQNEGIMRLMTNDTISISSLDIEDTPLLCFVIIPDESSCYSGLAAILINQLMSHFLKLADKKPNGRLPHRLWLILEELGNVGSSIKDLDKWMTGARSRNIRMCLVLQSDTSQLVDIYGESKAQTINGTCGITIGFSTNNWQTLEEWSKRCGNITVFEHGVFREEALISPTQLAAMPKGMALVMINGQYKYISQFPMYYKTHENIENIDSLYEKANKVFYPEVNVFDLVKFVKTAEKRKREELFSQKKNEDQAIEKFKRDLLGESVDIDSLFDD